MTRLPLILRATTALLLLTVAASCTAPAPKPYTWEETKALRPISQQRALTDQEIARLTATLPALNASASTNREKAENGLASMSALAILRTSNRRFPLKPAHNEQIRKALEQATRSPDLYVRQAATRNLQAGIFGK